MAMEEIEISGTEKAGTESYERGGQVFYPWRRFLARMFDIFICGALWSAFIASAFHVNLAARSRLEDFFDSFIAITIMLVLEPLWLHLSGTTPGKAIFGLKIKTLDGRRLSYGEGLERTWGVIGAGLGYNIPIYELVRLWKSYRLCSENEAQPWDESISYTIRDTKGTRGVLYIAAYAAVSAVLVMVSSAQRLPPYRGDLTVAEFVENHNYYSKFFGIGFGNKHLDENGRWAKGEFDGTVYVWPGNDEMPAYHFEVENGRVTGVSLTVEIRNNQDWISSYDHQMFLASLAFAGARSEIGLFSKIPGRIVELIDNNTFQDFNFTEAGIKFICDVESSGYTDSQTGFLIPEEDAAETYFNLNFSMTEQE